MTATPAAVTQPETEATHYGVSVAHIGEDGGMLALGHPGERRALAAFNRHARWAGLSNLADDPGAQLADWLGVTQEKWVTFRKPDPEQGEDPDFVWVCEDVLPHHPGAQPVTVLDVF